MIADGQAAQLRNHWAGWLATTLRPTLVGIPLLGLVGGFTAQLAGYGPTAGWIWGGATFPVLLALLVQIAVSMWRGEFGWISLRPCQWPAPWSLANTWRRSWWR